MEHGGSSFTQGIAPGIDDPADRGWRNRLAAWWNRQVAAWERRARHRVALAELRALDDRSLRDLGITRGDLPAIASGEFLRDPSRVARGNSAHAPRSAGRRPKC